MMFIRTINDKLLYQIFAFAQKKVPNFEANPKAASTMMVQGIWSLTQCHYLMKKQGGEKEKKRTKKIPPQKVCI